MRSVRTAYSRKPFPHSLGRNEGVTQAWPLAKHMQGLISKDFRNRCMPHGDRDQIGRYCVPPSFASQRWGDVRRDLAGHLVFHLAQPDRGDGPAVGRVTGPGSPPPSNWNNFGSALGHRSERNPGACSGRASSRQTSWTQPGKSREYTQ